MWWTCAAPTRCAGRAGVPRRRELRSLSSWSSWSTACITKPVLEHAAGGATGRASGSVGVTGARVAASAPAPGTRAAEVVAGGLRASPLAAGIWRRYVTAPGVIDVEFDAGAAAPDRRPRGRAPAAAVERAGRRPAPHGDDGGRPRSDAAAPLGDVGRLRERARDCRLGLLIALPGATAHARSRRSPRRLAGGARLGHGRERADGRPGPEAGARPARPTRARAADRPARARSGGLATAAGRRRCHSGPATWTTGRVRRASGAVRPGSLPGRRRAREIGAASPPPPPCPGAGADASGPSAGHADLGAAPPRADSAAPPGGDPPAASRRTGVRSAGGRPRPRALPRRARGGGWARHVRDRRCSLLRRGASRTASTRRAASAAAHGPAPSPGPGTGRPGPRRAPGLRPGGAAGPTAGVDRHRSGSRGPGPVRAGRPAAARGAGRRRPKSPTASTACWSGACAASASGGGSEPWRSRRP